MISMTIWKHGTAGDVKTPCGEVDIIQFSGENIKVDFIEDILKQSENGDLLCYLEKLPCEEWLDIDVTPHAGDDGWFFVVKAFKPSKIGFYNQCKTT